MCECGQRFLTERNPLHGERGETREINTQKVRKLFSSVRVQASDFRVEQKED